jgi:transcriptional regulator with XRE-family HTH domain
MSKIDLKRIRTLNGIKPSDLADKLFPNHKRAYQALNNVERGKTFLNTEQLSVLADIVGVPEGLLFTGNDWAMSVSKTNPSSIIFKTYDYVAEYDTRVHSSSISNSNGVMYEKIDHDHGMEITEYQNFLTDLIIKYKQK